MKLNKLAHYGDILAIPFFMVTFVYFYQLQEKTFLENLIMLFIFICFIMDVLFTFIYMYTK